MWEDLSLCEQERTRIAIIEGEIEETRTHGGWCLIGKIWIGKKVNKEAFMIVLSRIWRTKRGVIFKELDDNLWLFEFDEETDMRRVLERRPWSFDRQILVLTEFNKSIPPS